MQWDQRVFQITNIHYDSSVHLVLQFSASVSKEHTLHAVPMHFELEMKRFTQKPLCYDFVNNQLKKYWRMTDDIYRFLSLLKQADTVFKNTRNRC